MAMDYVQMVESVWKASVTSVNHKLEMLEDYGIGLWCVLGTDVDAGDLGHRCREENI